MAEQPTDHTAGPAGAVIPRSASERLADHVYDLKFDDLPEAVVLRVKELLVHHVGLALRANPGLLGTKARQIAQFLGGADGDCVLIGEPIRTGLLDAVFANSLMMRYGDMNDFQLPSGVHQGVATFPVALAFGERAHASGSEVITAVVAGYDVIAKLAGSMFGYQLSLPRQAYTLFAAFGAAAVAARLLGLSRDQTAHAMAHAAHVGAGLVEAGSFMEPLEPLVARNGAMTAVLAQAGMAMTRTSIEGDHGLFRSYAGQVPDTLDANLSTLGRTFEILKVSSKRYGGSGLNIVPQELTAGLLRTYGLTADDVVSVDVVLPQERERRETLMQTRLETGSDSPVWSSRFLVASVVACGEVSPNRYAEHRDARFEQMLANVRLRFEPGRPMRYCRIEIKTHDGERRVAEGDDHVFEPADPYTWLAEGGRQSLSEEQLRQLVKLIDALEHVEDLAELTACLKPAGSGAR